MNPAGVVSALVSGVLPHRVTAGPPGSGAFTRGACLRVGIPGDGSRFEWEAECCLAAGVTRRTLGGVARGLCAVHGRGL